MIEFNEKTNPYNKTHEISVTFFLKYLIPRVKKVKVNIEYFVQKNREDAAMHNKGDITQDDDREFTIRINRDLNLVAQVKTLAHECVHIKQYISEKDCDWSIIRNPRTSYEKYMLEPNELEAIAYAEFLLSILILNEENLHKDIYKDYDFAN
jgi:hypothetical protein